ncbi:MAG: hypothetical protein NT018_03595, partial [Armatimonadetes bacterium]|nr:hypothetical protein [Armatimonadota bacterium]
MKKLIGIGIAAMMLMGLAGSANAAYLFNLLVQNPENSLQKGSVQFATNTTSATPWTNPAGINPQVVGFAGNDPASTSLLTAYKNTVEPCSWYAKVFAANGYVGVYDVRVTS